MPCKITKVKGKKCYRVSTPTKTHAKCTSKKKAKRQCQLINAVEHGFTPNRDVLRKRVMGS